MLKKKDKTEVLLDDYQDPADNNSKKVIFDIIGIVLVIVFIIGTYLIIVFREEIIATLPFSKDENGKIVIKKDPENKPEKELEQLTAPLSGTYMKDASDILFLINEFEVDDKGLKFELTVNPGTKRTDDLTIIIDRLSIDGYEFPNHYEVKIDEQKSGKVEVLLEKTELDKYSIIRPNIMKIFFFNSEKLKSVPYIATINFAYNTPMDNSLKGLVSMGQSANLHFYYYKQESDLENTYLYFDVKNDSSSEKSIVRIKKLVINDKIIDINDIDEEIYYLTEKLFYIKIPRQKIAKVNKFTISFFVIINEDTDNERIYISKEFSHEE